MTVNEEVKPPELGPARASLIRLEERQAIVTAERASIVGAIEGLEPHIASANQKPYRPARARPLARRLGVYEERLAAADAELANIATAVEANRAVLAEGGDLDY